MSSHFTTRRSQKASGLLTGGPVRQKEETSLDWYQCKGVQRAQQRTSSASSREQVMTPSPTRLAHVHKTFHEHRNPTVQPLVTLATVRIMHRCCLSVCDWFDDGTLVAWLYPLNWTWNGRMIYDKNPSPATFTSAMKWVITWIPAELRGGRPKKVHQKKTSVRSQVESCWPRTEQRSSSEQKAFKPTRAVGDGRQVGFSGVRGQGQVGPIPRKQVGKTLESHALYNLAAWTVT